MPPPSHATVIEAHEKQLEDLRRLFDLYFQGLERQPPKDQHEAVKKALQRLRGDAARWSTADRFRVNTLHQKFGTYDRMWSRQLQAIEDGTHRRDRFRVQRKRQAEEEAAKAQAQAPTAVPQPAAPPGAARRPAAAAGEGGMSDERLRKLYDVYMQAKRRTGEKTNLSFEGLAAQLRKQVPALKAKHNCRDVDFKVVLKDGKAMLKAVPKP